jgi:hypothetical protein
MENLVTHSMRYFFSIIREALKPNFLPNIRYFKIIFEDLDSFSKNLKLERKNWKIKVSVSEKKNSAPITKLDLAFGCTLATRFRQFWKNIKTASVLLRRAHINKGHLNSIYSKGLRCKILTVLLSIPFNKLPLNKQGWRTCWRRWTLWILRG